MVKKHKHRHPPSTPSREGTKAKEAPPQRQGPKRPEESSQKANICGLPRLLPLGGAAFGSLIGWCRLSFTFGGEVFSLPLAPVSRGPPWARRSTPGPVVLPSSFLKKYYQPWSFETLPSQETAWICSRSSRSSLVRSPDP